MPPNGARAASALSGVAFWTMATTAAVPGFISPWTCEMNSCLIPVDANEPNRAPNAPPMSRPATGTKNSSPMSMPHSAPLVAPAPVAWVLVAMRILPS